MCLAILKPAGKIVSKEHLSNGYDRNSDGAGFAYAENGEVVIQKGFFKFEEFYAAYQPHENKQCLIHFRIRTAGQTDAVNCHPWRINPKMALIHNGMLPIREDAGLSDTGIFTNRVISPIVDANPDIIFTNGFKWLIESAIGSNNKVVILNSAGGYVIFNEKSGSWDDGVWYSNCSYKVARYTSVGYQTGRHHGATFGDYDDAHGWAGFHTANHERFKGIRNRSSGEEKKKSFHRWKETNVPNVFILTPEYNNAFGPARHAENSGS